MSDSSTYNPFSTIVEHKEESHNPFVSFTLPQTVNKPNTEDPFVIPTHEKKNLILATNDAGEPQWITFGGGKDSYNPFEEMENERRKELRLNPYQGEQDSNPFYHNSKKVQQEFVNKVNNQHK